MMNLMINYHNHWWYKAITWLLIIAIVLLISFGTALKARAIGILTATMAAAILAVLAGAGIYTVVSGMTSNQIQDWLNQKLDEWDIYRDDGNVFSDLIQNNLITATIKGTLAIGTAAAQGISDFISWLVDDLSLTDNDTESILSVSGTDLSSIFPTINKSNYWTVNGGYYFTTVSGTTAAGAIDFLLDSNANIEFDFNFVAYKSIFSSWYNWQLFTNVKSYSNVVNCTIDRRGDNGLYTLYPQETNSDTVTGSGHVVFENQPGFGSSAYLGNSFYNITISNLVIDNVTVSQPDSSLTLDTDVIGIPQITDEVIDLQVGAYPGAIIEEVTDVILDGVLDNTLDVDMTVTDEIADAQEVYIINEQPISVNTDHHMIGFTNLPDFTHLNLNSIWHYVSDAVEYASDFISWFVNMITSVPSLSIPLYMSFTLLIVLSFIRRILL